MGIIVMVHWFCFTVNLGRTWAILQPSTERPHGLVGGRERALRISGHGDGAAARPEKRTATRRLLVVWAVLDGTVLQGWPLLVATVVLPPRKTPELT